MTDETEVPPSPVSFAAEWEGFPHTVVVPHMLVEQDAGQPLTAAEAEAHVHQHLHRYLASARRAGAHQAIPAERIVMLESIEANELDAGG